MPITVLAEIQVLQSVYFETIILLVWHLRWYSPQWLRFQDNGGDDLGRLGEKKWNI